MAETRSVNKAKGRAKPAARSGTSLKSAAKAGGKTRASTAKPRRTSRKSGAKVSAKAAPGSSKKVVVPPRREKKQLTHKLEQGKRPMNEQFTNQAQAMFDAAKDARFPEGIQSFAQDSIEKSREAYGKLNDAAQEGAKVVEEVMLASQAGAKTLGEKMVRNTVANTEAAFDAAQAMARARSVPEFYRLQSDYMQQQVAAAGAQTKELFELSSKVAQQTFETMSEATTKTFDALKK